MAVPKGYVAKKVIKKISIDELSLNVIINKLFSNKVYYAEIIHRAEFLLNIILIYFLSKKLLWYSRFWIFRPMIFIFLSLRKHKNSKFIVREKKKLYFMEIIKEEENLKIKNIPNIRKILYKVTYKKICLFNNKNKQTV